jgi:hypothetical protein
MAAATPVDHEEKALEGRGKAKGPVDARTEECGRVTLKVL